MSRRVAFLDRDGTLNVDDGFVHRPEDWQFIRHATLAVKLLRQAGYFVAIVTNQSGIAAGYYSEDDVIALHEYAQRQLESYSTQIDAFAYCPHGRDSTCDCRKPKPGMAHQIEDMLGDTIDYAASWVIGDKISDIDFGKSLGTNTALLRSRYWSDDQLDRHPNVIGDSLYEVVSHFMNLSTDNPRGSDETRRAP